MAETKVAPARLNMFTIDSSSATSGDAVVFDTGNNTIRSTVPNFKNYPPGIVFDYAGNTAPSYTKECANVACNKTDYAALYSAIGDTWGNNSTHFYTPDLRRRVTIGHGGTPAANSSVSGNTVGSIGGTETHQLSSNQMPQHSHVLNNNLVQAPAGSTDFSYSGNGAIAPAALNSPSTTNSGNSEYHPIMQPSAVVMKIITTGGVA
jgi:microcystin-dependent protein